MKTFFEISLRSKLSIGTRLQRKETLIANLETINLVCSTAASRKRFSQDKQQLVLQQLFYQKAAQKVARASILL